MIAKKILVPLDGSRLAEAALPEAIELGRAGATLMLLRAAEATQLLWTDPADAQAAVVRGAEDYLDAVAERARKAGVAHVETSVWYGGPAEAIVDAAQFCSVDLIVMTTHGRSGLGRLVLGSVAETVVRGTTTPILLLRDHEAPVMPTAVGAARPAREASHV
jgi:nucleotide-binding universal stress UspA family protein